MILSLLISISTQPLPIVHIFVAAPFIEGGILSVLQTHQDYFISTLISIDFQLFQTHLGAFITIETNYTIDLDSVDGDIKNPCGDCTRKQGRKLRLSKNFELLLSVSFKAQSFELRSWSSCELS